MDIEKFVAYANQYEPGFGSRIVGASNDEIETFEKLVGRPLPASYKSFLSRLGKNDGGLKIGDTSSTRLDHLIEYYSDVVRDGSAAEDLPANCIVVAYIGVGTFELSLDLASGPEPRVVFTSGRHRKGPMAESLEKVLYRTVFERFRMQRLSCRAYYHAPPGKDSVTEATDLVVANGIVGEWFSDDVCFCGANEGALVTVSKILDYSMAAEFGAPRNEPIDQLADLFQNRFGFSRAWRIGNGSTYSKPR